MDEANEIDVLFVGAGPASLAGAIRLKQLLKQNERNESVVVLEKAEVLGQHNLSGAIFEADILEELVPGWKEKKDAFVTRMLKQRVERDEIYLISGNGSALKIPEFLIPGHLHHKGNYTLSVSELVKWLGDIATGLGVDIYNSFAARELVLDGNTVKGVKLGDRGLDKQGKPQANYIPGEVLPARITVLGEGSLGLLTEDLVKRAGPGVGRNPQVYSVGVKEIIRLPEKNNFGANRVIHTLGFPKSDIFGGGTLYSMGDNTVAVALLLGLDWKYCDLDPQLELQLFKSHGFISKLLQGGETIAYGAKTIPEGGYYSIPDLVMDGALVIGDAAGLTNVKKLKGLHYAMKSGMIAAEAIFKAIEKKDFSKQILCTYQDLLNKSFVMKDIQEARNYRQVFTKTGRAGVYMGAPLSMIQQWLPSRLKTEPDWKSLRKTRLKRRSREGIDHATAVSLSGTTHREDQLSHIGILDSKACIQCGEEYECHPCESFCPAGVYQFKDGELILSPSNCLHCQTCQIKCPHQVIKWQVPEGGDGPRYKIM